MDHSDENYASVKDRAIKKLERDMGSLLLSTLHDPRTIEIMLNADGKLWVERLGKKMECFGLLRVAQSEAIIKTVAGFHGKGVTTGNPILEGEFPIDRSRFAANFPLLSLSLRLLSVHRALPPLRCRVNCRTYLLLYRVLLGNDALHSRSARSYRAISKYKRGHFH
jgi:Flp pilus assembly CpaF family ATPase